MNREMARDWRVASAGSAATVAPFVLSQGREPARARRSRTNGASYDETNVAAWRARDAGARCSGGAGARVRLRADHQSQRQRAEAVDRGQSRILRDPRDRVAPD